MGLLDFIAGIFKGPDVTRTWIESAAVELELDFDECSLSGVPNGPEGAGQLEWLGKAEGRNSSVYYWYSKGLTLSVNKDGSFDGGKLSFEQLGESKFRPYQGKCVISGRRIAIEPSCTKQRIIDLLGEPSERDIDEDPQLWLFYDIGIHLYSFAFDSNERLRELDFYPRTAVICDLCGRDARFTLDADLSDETGHDGAFVISCTDDCGSILCKECFNIRCDGKLTIQKPGSGEDEETEVVSFDTKYIRIGVALCPVCADPPSSRLFLRPLPRTG